MIFLKKDENERVTGGYKVTFGVVHMFFIFQVVCVILTIVNKGNILFALAPTLIISSVLAFPMFLGDVIGGFLGIIKIFRKEKVSLYSILRSALITSQVIGWIFAILGKPMFDNFAILFIIFAYDLALSALILLFFITITVVSDLLLAIGLQKAGFALKSLFDKIKEYAAKKQEKEKVQ